MLTRIRGVPDLVTGFLVVMGFLSVAAVRVMGTEYCVAPMGSDGNPGTLEAPFATIEKAARKVRPGDTVYVREGVYRGPVRLASSGTEAARITFRAFPGERPVVDGSKPVGTWTKHSGEIYRAQITVNANPVVVDDKPLDHAESVEEMTEGTSFQVDNTLYVWCPGGGSPQSRAVGVIKKFEDWNEPAIVGIQGSYITFSGFTVRHGSGGGIVCTGNWVRIEDCEEKFAVVHGITISRGWNCEVANCVVHDNCLKNWPRGSNNWGMGLSHCSGGKGKFIGNRVFRNNGEGIGTWGPRNGKGSVGLEIRNNVVYDNWSVNIWLDHATGAVVDGNFVYVSKNRPKPEERRSRPTGILCAEEDLFGQPGDLRDGVITNNIVVACGNGLGLWYDKKAPEGAGLKNFLVANNTFVNCTGSAVWVQAGNHSGTVFRNNIFYQSTGGLLHFGNPGDTVFDHNCWFSKRRGRLFRWGETAYDFKGWQGVMGGRTGSMQADPGFVVGTGFEAASYKIVPASVCREAGLPVEGVTTDFWGTVRPWGAAWDIGACEYSVPKPKRKPKKKAGRPDKVAEKKKQEEELLALGKSAAPELHKWVIEGVTSGRKLSVYVTIMGANTRARITAADETGLSATGRRGETQVPWDDVSASQLYKMAKKYAAPKGKSVPSERKELLKAFALANGLEAER